jgi:hypothetical protein
MKLLDPKVWDNTAFYTCDLYPNPYDALKAKRMGAGLLLNRGHLRSLDLGAAITCDMKVQSSPDQKAVLIYKNKGYLSNMFSGF